MFDWDFFADFDDTTIILKELTKRDLALLSSAMSFLEKEIDWENETWDALAAKLSEVQERLSHDTYVCPPGDTTDYTLESDITLTVDATTYTLSDLELLAGRDLIIEIQAASTTSGVKDLRSRINGLSTSIYQHRLNRTQTTTTIQTGTNTYLNIIDGLNALATPQESWSWFRYEFPDWKNTGTFPIVYIKGYGDTHHWWGRVKLADAGAVSSFSFFADSDDIVAGTKIAVYTRG